MPRLEAKRIRQRLQLSGQKIAAEQMHDLILLETGDAEEANRAASDIIAAELRAGRTPR